MTTLNKFRKLNFLPRNEQQVPYRIGENSSIYYQYNERYPSSCRSKVIFFGSRNSNPHGYNEPTPFSNVFILWDPEQDTTGIYNPATSELEAGTYLIIQLLSGSSSVDNSTSNRAVLDPIRIEGTILRGFNSQRIPTQGVKSSYFFAKMVEVPNRTTLMVDYPLGERIATNRVFLVKMDNFTKIRTDVDNFYKIGHIPYDQNKRLYSFGCTATYDKNYDPNSSDFEDQLQDAGLDFKVKLGDETDFTSWGGQESWRIGNFLALKESTRIVGSLEHDISFSMDLNSSIPRNRNTYYSPAGLKIDSFEPFVQDNNSSSVYVSHIEDLMDLRSTVDPVKYSDFNKITWTPDIRNINQEFIASFSTLDLSYANGYQQLFDNRFNPFDPNRGTLLKNWETEVINGDTRGMLLFILENGDYETLKQLRISYTSGGVSLEKLIGCNANACLFPSYGVYSASVRTMDGANFDDQKIHILRFPVTNPDMV